MIAAVDTSLAASVLAILDTVRADLETATPRVGRVQAQVGAAFARHRQSFVKLAAADLAHFGELPARAAAETLADDVNNTAVFAVAEGMDLQLARGWAPEVAWQRVLVAYGLDSRRMHAYLGAVLGGDPKQATTVVPPAAREAVENMRVTYCDEVARDGVAAAESCAGEEEITKDYDPQEIRDAHGRWAKKPTSRTRVAERDPVLDAVEQQEPDRYATAEKDRYATAEKDRYATAEKDRYATAEPDRYATAEKDRYATAAEDRYAQATRPLLRRRLIVMMTPTAPKTEEDVIEAEEESEAATASGGGFYLPAKDLDRYNGRNFKGDLRTSIDFSQVKQFYLDEAEVGLGEHRDGTELQHAYDGWDVTEGANIDPGVWQTLVDEALPLFDDVMDDPVFAADQLYGEDLADIAKRAGMPDSDAVMVKREIATAVQSRDSGINYDESLLNALADHIVWTDPSVLGDKGAAFAQTLEDYGVEDKLDDAVPEVLSFHYGLADEDDAADLTGEYYAKTTIYHSALGEHRDSAPVGFVGLREVTMRPRV